MGQIIEFFIKNVRLNYVLLLFLFLIGIYSYISMPKEIFPPFVLNKISITGSYRGASPEILDSLVVRNIEDEINNISGISKTSSMITSGFFHVIVELGEKKNKDLVLDKIKDSIGKIKKDLPNDMDEPIASHVIYEIPLILINIASDENISHDYVLDVAKEIKSKLSQINELSNINIYGKGRKELEIVLDSSALKAYNLDPSLVVNELSRLSSIFPIGKIEEKGGKHFFISTYNGKKEIKDIESSILKVNGKIFRIKDIATISKHYKNDKTISSFNGQNTITTNVSKSEKGNAIALAQLVKEEVKKFQEKYPQLTIETFSDVSVYIRNRLNTITSNIFFGLILVGFCLYVLVNSRISFVVLIGIPSSFVISLLFFYLLGYSINMMSLLGALIALGVIVDDAIIVAENIQRHLDEGMPISQAALLGTKEVLRPVLAASFTTICAFIPLLLFTGELGEFIKIIPIAISILILASLIESFIFLPLHSKHLLKKGKKELDWTKLTNIYKKIIRLLIHFRKTTIFSFYIIVPLLIYFGFSTSKFQQFPPFDGDQLTISGKLPVNTSLEETYKVGEIIENHLLSKKDEFFIDSTTLIAGFRMDSKGMSETGINFFQFFIDLEKAKPNNIVAKYITPYLSLDYDDTNRIRTIEAYELEEIIRNDLNQVLKDIKIEELDIKGPRSGLVSNAIEIYVETNNEEDAAKTIDELQNALLNIKGTNSIINDAKLGTKEIKLKINNYGESLGATEEMIMRLLSGYFLEASISKSFDDDGILEIVSRDKNKNYFQTLKNFHISLDDGRKVQLDHIVDFKQIENYEKVFKENGVKRRMVASGIDKDYNVNDIMNQLKPIIEKIKKEGKVKLVFGGEEEANQQLINETLISFSVASFLIFMILLIMFNSFKSTFIILSVIPFSILGIIFGHKIMGLDFTMPSIIGVVGLAGVVINDGIIMLDFIRNSKDIDELLQRAKLRVRPIILTTITTLMGLSTLIFFPSGQAVILQPLAVSLGFGLFWGTFLNLVYLPVLFALVNHTKEIAKKKIINKEAI